MLLTKIALSRRHSFFLLEIIIAAMVSSGIIAATMGLYFLCKKTATTYEKKIKTLENDCGKIARFRSILRSIQKKTNDPFYVEHTGSSDHLYFFYFAGVRHEEKTSGERAGQIYVNEAHQLLFVSSPPKKQNAATSEKEETAIILFENVSSIHFSFIVHPKVREKIPEIASQPNDTPLNTWGKEWACLPSVIQAHIQFINPINTSEKSPLILSTIISSSIQPIQV